jgi:glycosyltransferase involved in cell wall biosynthesis
MANVLVIIHETERSGAPILLLNLLKIINSKHEHRITFLVKNKGCLQEEFLSIGPCFDWAKVSKNNSLDKHILEKIYYKFFHKGNKFYLKRFLQSYWQEKEENILIVNSVASADVFYCIGEELSWKVISVIHEQGYLLNMYNKKGEVNFLLQKSDRVICISKTVIKDLTSLYGHSSKYTLVNGGVAISESQNLVKSESKDFRLLCVGYLHWNKGIDSFIHLAALIKKEKIKDIKLTWVGADPSTEEYKNMVHDLNRLGIQEQVEIISKVDDMSIHYTKTDLVLVLSRNESLSLLALESSAMKLPFLCFEGCGGPTEIIEDDERFIVPYLDIFNMLKRVIFLKNNRDKLFEMGLYAFEKVNTNFNVIRTARYFEKVIFRSADQLNS